MVGTIRVYKRKPRKEDATEVKPKETTDFEFAGLKISMVNSGEKSIFVRKIDGWW